MGQKNHDIYVDALLQSHILYCNSIKDIKKQMKCVKNIRQPNSPEVISEYLTQKSYKLKFNDDVSKKTGDINCGDKKIEVKCFTSKGPSSFGPKESWDELIFVDAINFKNRFFQRALYYSPARRENLSYKTVKQ